MLIFSKCSSQIFHNLGEKVVLRPNLKQFYSQFEFELKNCFTEYSNMIQEKCVLPLQYSSIYVYNFTRISGSTRNNNECSNCSNELATYSISNDPFHRNYSQTIHTVLLPSTAQSPREREGETKKELRLHQ